MASRRPSTWIRQESGIPFREILTGRRIGIPIHEEPIPAYSYETGIRTTSAEALVIQCTLLAISRASKFFASEVSAALPPPPSFPEPV